MHFFHKNKSHPTISAPLEANPDALAQHIRNAANRARAEKKLRKSLLVQDPAQPPPQSQSQSQSQSESTILQQQQQQPPAQLVSLTTQGSSASLEQHHEHNQQRFVNDSYNSPYSQSTTVTGSYSQLSDQSGRPALNVVPVRDPADLESAVVSAPQSPEGFGYSEVQPRKSRRSFFGFGKDKEKDKDKEKTLSGKLGRKISVRKKSQTRKSDIQEEPAGEKREPDYSRSQSRLDSHSAASGSSANLESSEHSPRPLQRVNTEPLGPLNFISQQQPQYYQQGGAQLSSDQLSAHPTRSSLQVDPYQRPASQQSFAAPSPLPPSYHDHRPSQGSLSMPKSTAPDRPTGLRQAVDPHGQGQQYPPPGIPQGGSFKGMHQDNGQDLPPPPPSKEENDGGMRALAQKHEELRMHHVLVFEARY